MYAFLQHLEHRGPDDLGWLMMHRGKIAQGQDVQHDLVGELVFLHRRLSILDLSDGGHQPMGTADGRYWIIFNGEIYNYVELRQELEVLGYQFRSSSDTEVLLAAYAQWGTRVLNRLVGMFALAIVDVKTRRLLLARDNFGIKPLYYSHWQDGFAFASEIKPLLDLPGVSRSVNPERLYDYLRSGITDHEPDTLFAGIKQLPAAHYMEVPLDSPNTTKPVRYWEIDLTAQVELSFDEAASRLRELFLESIHLHLRSDVPIGAALSGGIDSSSIVMGMRHLDHRLDIHAFSYIAEDSAVSEERWVDIVGKAANAIVHKVKPTPEEMVVELDHLIGVQGEPFGSTSIYAQSRVFRLASQAGIKVMLDGQGADELLSGYPSYRVARIASLLRQGQWAQAVELSCASRTIQAPWKLLLRAAGLLAPSSIQAVLRRLLRRDAVPSWLNADWFRAHGVPQTCITEVQGREFLKHELYQTLKATSLPQLLRYEDRNSMAVSVESRVPFLTPALANFVFALPEQYIIGADGTTKSVFRRAMRGLVPDAVLDRRDKLGFPTPQRRWLLSMGTWVERVMTSPTARQIGAVDSRAMHGQWGEIVQGRGPFDSRIWRWVNLILWAEKFSIQVD